MNKLRKIFVDANIWCWYFNFNSKYHKKTKSFLDELIRQPDIKLFVNSFVVIEVFHYLIKNLGPIIGKKKAKRFLEFNFIKIRPLEDLQDLFIQILDQLVKYGTHTTIGGRNSSILVTMNNDNIQEIITHDQGFTHIPSITVIDPID